MQRWPPSALALRLSWCARTSTPLRALIAPFDGVDPPAPSTIARLRDVMLTSGSALELPKSAMTTELACEWLLPPVEAFIASVSPVTWAFAPITTAVLSVKFVFASALLKSKPPPLSDFAPFSEFSDVSASILMLPPALIVMFDASTWLVDDDVSALMLPMLEKS